MRRLNVNSLTVVITLSTCLSICTLTIHSFAKNKILKIGILITLSIFVDD